MKRKKVLWVNHFMPYPPRGGLLIRTNGLLDTVIEEHDVTLLFIVQPRLVTPFFSSYDEGLKKGLSYFSEKGAEPLSFPLDSEKTHLRKLWTLLYSLFTIKPYSVNWLKTKELESYIQRLNLEQYDCIHVDTMALMELFTGIKTTTPIIVNHHNAEHTMMYRRASKENNILKKCYMWLEAKKIECYDSKVVGKVTTNLVCSPEDASSLKKMDRSAATKLVPNGVTYKASVQRTPTLNKLLFIGGLDWYPNEDAINYLLDSVMPHLCERNIAIQLDIVGKNPSDEIIRKVGKFDNVTLHGYVEDIEVLYSNALAFICPLRDGGGTKLKVLDAMMHGLPVIGSDIAFEGINIEHGVSGLVSNSVDDILQNIELLQKYPKKVNEIGLAARAEISRNYNAKSISKGYSDFISSF